MLKNKKDKLTRPARVKYPKDHRFSYHQIDELKTFISAQGMIISRERSGLTQKQQRQLALEIKRARHLALLPFVQTI